MTTGVETQNYYGLRERAIGIIGEDRLPREMLELIVQDYGPRSPIEMETYLEHHAGLLHQVGCILIDRREGDDDGPLVWEYLYENMSVIYDQFAKVIDDVEVQVFG